MGPSGQLCVGPSGQMCVGPSGQMCMGRLGSVLFVLCYFVVMEHQFMGSPGSRLIDQLNYNYTAKLKINKKLNLVLFPQLTTMLLSHPIEIHKL